MKKLSRLLIPAFAALVLTGCGKNDWFTLAPAAGGDTQQSTSAQGGGQATSSSAQGGGQATSSSQQGGGGGTSQTPSGSYTLESVIQDIVKAVFEQSTAVLDTDYYADDEDGSGFYTLVAYSSATSSDLQSCVEDVAQSLPSYLTFEEGYSDYWDEEETDPGYFAYYITSDESVEVELASYYESANGVVVQISTDEPLSM